MSYKMETFEERKVRYIEKIKKSHHDERHSGKECAQR